MANQQHATDDPQEKLQNLKLLSAVLLKENIERQQQVESLLQAKEDLEIQLGQIAAEKTDSKTESVRESEERVCLETMKGMFSVFLENQMDTMGVLVRSLVRENGEKEKEIGLLKSEINGLKVNLEGEREKFREISVQRDQLREKVIEKKEKKIQAEEEISKLKVKIDEVKKAIEEFSRNFRETVRMQKFGGDCKDGLTETLLVEKEKIEDDKVSKENEIAKLQEELFGLQESIKVEQDQNKHLASEVSHCRATLEEVKLEKDKARRDLFKETKKSPNLMSRVFEMDKSFRNVDLASKCDKIEPCAIKSAFTSKETAAEEMKQQIKVLQNSVKEASMEKYIWAVYASLLTFLFSFIAFVVFLVRILSNLGRVS